MCVICVYRRPPKANRLQLESQAIVGAKYGGVGNPDFVLGNAASALNNKPFPEPDRSVLRKV